MEKKGILKETVTCPKITVFESHIKNLKYYVKKKKDRESQDVLDVA